MGSNFRLVWWALHNKAHEARLPGGSRGMPPPRKILELRPSDGWAFSKCVLTLQHDDTSIQ